MCFSIRVMSKYLLKSPNYDPAHLLNTVRDQCGIKNDAALACLLDKNPGNVSAIRHKRIPVGPATLIKLHELSGIEIRELRRLMGDERQSFFDRK